MIARRIAFYVALVLLLLFVLFPLYWVVTTSLKTTRDAFAFPPTFVFTPTFENFVKVLDNRRFVGSFFNSFIVSISSSVIAVAVGSIAAYGLAQQDGATRRSNEKFILSLRIAPPLLFVIPIYYLATRTGLMDTLGLLIAVYAFINVPFAISLLLTFFEDIPKELRDAARVDGAKELSIFLKVVLPAARGGVIATLILCVLFTWNEFFVALVLSGRSTQTLPVSVTSFLTFQGIEWGVLMAAATIIMLPMIVLGFLVQGRIVRGMSVGGVKG